MSTSTENEAFTATGAANSSVTNGFLEKLIDQMTLARAAEMARAGHYAEAEEVLTVGKGKTGFGPAALDLLARIHAQQGRLMEAEKLWTRASSLDPFNSAYTSALRRAASLRHGSRRPIIMFPLVACALLGALIGLWWRFGPVRNSPQDGQVQTVATPSPAVTASQQTPAPSQALEATTAQNPIENGIKVRGVTVTKQPDGLTLSFDDGLFQRGLTLKPGAREKLTELGRNLKPYAGNCTVEIIGMTDELPILPRARYRDNLALGMDRARFVYDYLRFTASLDLVDVTIGSSGSVGQTSDQSEQATNRARRRTVVLHIGVR